MMKIIIREGWRRTRKGGRKKGEGRGKEEGNLDRGISDISNRNGGLSFLIFLISMFAMDMDEKHYLLV